jgi:sterol desaturase/sphingolipid hydroxylase (fatty acid hydroxylase superfamily)
MELKNHPHAKGTKSLFKNPILEKLTRTHISVPLIIFGLVSVGLMAYGIREEYVYLANAPVFFIAGVLTFTLIEYAMHRWIFHLQPKTEKQEKFAYTIHGVHHDYPKDRDRLAMPPPLSILLSTGFFFFFKIIMGNLVFAFLPGFLLGYAAYLWVHYMVHAFKPPKNLFKFFWVHHGLHHYKDQHNAFGVSSPFWDLVFGTMPKK